MASHYPFLMPIRRVVATPWKYFAWGVIAGSAVALLCVRYASFPIQNSPATKIEESSSRPVRLTEGRLTGQSTYMPFSTTPRKIDPRSTRSCIEAAKNSPRERALCYLSASDLDLAIRETQKAQRLAPDEPPILSDLSTLYIERARTENEPADYILALVFAERALAAAPRLPEALLNRGIALERLFLPSEARTAWMRYIEADNDAAWIDETKERLRKLPISNIPPNYYALIVEALGEGNIESIAKLARESPEDARVVLENEVWLGWVAAIASSHQDQAETRVSAAKHIAAVLSLQGDRLLAKFAEELENVTRLRTTEQRSTILFKSLQHLKAAREMTESESRRCLDEFVLARQGLRSIRSSLALSAQIWETACVDKYDHGRARTLLLMLEDDPLLVEYASLRVRVLEVIGRYEESSGDVTAAITTHRKALEMSRSLIDKVFAVRLANRIAANLEFLGREEEAWRYRYQALRWSRDVRSLRYRAPSVLGSLLGASQAAIAQRHLEVALHFQNQYVKDADHLGILFPSVYGRLIRARIALATGKAKEAKQDLEHVLDKLERIPMGDRPDLAAEIEVVSSRIQESDDQAAAIIDDLYLRSQDQLEPGYLDARADMLFRSGETAAAEAELVRALEELERRREMIGSREDRASFLDRERALYERMIALQLNLARPEKALEVLERFRARTLLDQLQEVYGQGSSVMTSEAARTPLSSQEIVRRMPARTVVVVYAVIGGRLTTWLVRQSGVVVVRSRPSWTTVGQAVQKLHEIGRTDFAAMRPVLEQLYSSLVESWSDDLHADDRIIFIPTLDLFRVPFAALVKPASGRFLVQDQAVGIAPSASQFISALERDLQGSRKPLSNVLLVGDPSRGSSHPSLPALPGSAREIEALRKIYHGLSPEVLVRRDATSTRVRNALGRIEVAHFAVHAIKEQEEPGNSRLVLSGLGETPSHLYARDVLRLQLYRMRLVFLAACETQAGPVSVSEGSLSLAAAFLAAGVPAVVATLWTVEDRTAARLSVRFHEHLRRGSDALSALRATQLEELATNSGNSDLTWAGYQVIGGVAASPKTGYPLAMGMQAVPVRKEAGLRRAPPTP